MPEKKSRLEVSKKVNQVIEYAGLPDTAEMRRLVEDILLNRHDRYTEEELQMFDEMIAKRILERLKKEMAGKGVKLTYEIRERETNPMFG